MRADDGGREGIRVLQLERSRVRGSESAGFKGYAMSHPSNTPDSTPSFAELAKRLTPDLRRYLQRYVGDPSTAEDLLQEALFRIDRGLPSFERRSSIRTWAFAIATRVGADYLRKPEHRIAIVDIDEADAVTDSAKPAEDRLVIDEMSSCVRGVIDSLPEDYRAALLLHELQGLTAEETANVCGTTVANAKIRIHRGRARLKAALNEACTFYRNRDDVLRCDRKQGPSTS
jgi:RNA polymerase sigma-70 factor (ECF subfamily)